MFSYQKPVFFIHPYLAFKDLGLHNNNYLKSTHKGDSYTAKRVHHGYTEKLHDWVTQFFEHLRQKYSVNLIQSDEIQRIISDMHETVLDADGAGLAAPQVFVSKQIVLLDLDDENGMQVWINPKITPLTEDVMIGFEGCLSVPNMRGACCQICQNIR